MVDIDLWTRQPDGEEASYNNRSTYVGGQNSRDFTQGYGPEEYMIKTALPGEYVVSAKYYGSGRQDLAGATTLLLSFDTDFGRPNQKRTNVTLRLSKNKQKEEVGRITMGSRAARDAASKNNTAAVDVTSNVFVFTDTDGDRICITRHATSGRLTTVANDATESCDWKSYDHGDGTYVDSGGHGTVPQGTRAALQAWLETSFRREVEPRMPLVPPLPTPVQLAAQRSAERRQRL
jgi:hypothetical protein